MKLLFTIPENPHNIFSSSLIKGWLNYNRVFFGETCLRVSYNTVYDFYDVYIYRSSESNSNWDLLVNDITSLNEVEKVDNIWSRDEGGMKVDVVRFWIPCHSDKEKDPVPLPCPFCGGVNIEVDSSGVMEFTSHDEQLGTVECRSCCGSIEYNSKDPLGDPSERGAILKWNKRGGYSDG